VRSATATALGTLGTLHALGTFHTLGTLHALGTLHPVGAVSPHDAVATPILPPVGPVIFTTDVPGCPLCRTVFPTDITGSTFRRAVFLANVRRRALGENHARSRATQDDSRNRRCDDAFLQQHGSAPFLEFPSRSLDARP